MIEDPKQIKHSDDWYDLIKGKVGQTVFYRNVTDDDLSFCQILDDVYPTSKSYDIFSVNKRYHKIYSILGTSTKKEEFIDFLDRCYPDILEWFLFHPEWLE